MAGSLIAILQCRISVHNIAMTERLKADRGYAAAGLAAVTVIAACAVIAKLGILATSGGVDQQYFHLPSVMYLREKFPNIDIVNMPTATGPLYHLLVSVVSGPLHLGTGGTQIVGSLFAAALAAVAVWYVRKISTVSGQLLAVAPLLLSPYFWQSALWMLTDDAAILFAFAALIAMLSGTTGRHQLISGLLIACAIATRQTYVWLLAPAVVNLMYVLRNYSASVRIWAVGRVAAPGMMVLAILVSLWGGLTPPSTHQFNASSYSFTSISYTFAVAAIFLTPILLATLGKSEIRERIPTAFTVGLLAAVPAIVFSSGATNQPDESRRGGFVWSVVAIFPDVADRSLLLIVLAFIGGFVGTIVCFTLTRQIALLLATSLVSVAIVTAAGSQLYQKYIELPVAVLVLIALVYLFRVGRIIRTWPLLLLALFQLAMTASIVILPIWRALSA